jgi:hypothetical protein
VTLEKENHEMRSRLVPTAVGDVELLRPWYLCAHSHNGQFPGDVAPDIDKTDLCPGLRRMLALVGSESSFDHGREQIKLLAGLEVTAKAVERTAEAIGRDIAGRFEMFYALVERLKRSGEK